VIAADTEDFSACAVALNAEVNEVHVECLTVDLLDGSRPEGHRHDVILVGDLFYERTMAERVFAFLSDRLAAGAQVLIGDPGRTYLPKQGLRRLAEYSVPVTRDLEDTEFKRTAVFALAA
jgi:predicted nicotinamide N-methyase